MLLGIHHIGVAIKSLEEGMNSYLKLFNQKPREVHQMPQAGMQAAIYHIGDVEIELMEPLGSEGAVAKFLESRGEGIHHICIEVDNIENELKRLTEQSIRLVDPQPRQGIGGKVAFIHPKSTSGVLIELLQKDKK